MTAISRRIITIPARSASEAWKVVVNLITDEIDSEAQRELLEIMGIASSLITDEAMKDAPIVVCGGGPRVRIYCLYGDDAIIGEKANETTLPFSPTDGDWEMSLPCPAEDLDWVQEALKKRSGRITARDMTTGIEVEVETPESQKAQGALVDKEAFFRL